MFDCQSNLPQLQSDLATEAKVEALKRMLGPVSRHWGGVQRGVSGGCGHTAVPRYC